ncbi:MAG: hypothetical protein ABR514_07175 [Chthoniobacterales bacterium]
MKPTPTNEQNARKFPLVDYNYHSATLPTSVRCCGNTSKSLRDISRDYFDSEANHDFLSEVAVFGTLIAMAVVPIISGAFAVVDLCRALPLF